jgi:nicotinamide mononucleotide transporter
MAKEIEYLAAALAVLYVLLAIKQWRSCWIAAFVSSVLYVLVFFQARLYMESLLNAFYAATAIYGYWCWRAATTGGQGARVHRWPLRSHALALLAVLVLAALNSWVLARYTPAASPFVDSLIAWSSVFATFLVARKVFENWHWWLVIDALTMLLSYTRGLYTTALLFALYLAMIIVGMREWRRDLEPAHA